MEPAAGLLRAVRQLERAKIRLTRHRVGQALEDRVHGFRVERDDAIVLFPEDTGNFPPGAQSQRQLWIDLPGIVNEVPLIVRAGQLKSRGLVRSSGRDTQ